ncbi:MAG: DUF2796 domain-containing protein [Magnetovibrio sp.]|nr:DUF2796 domain-containing protein [Magnetovibrio sp.]
MPLASRLPFVLLAAALAALPHPGAAQSGHGAHQHGVAHLALAIEGDEVEIELTVPGADAVGFEHAPSTPEQKKAVERAAHAFRDARALFTFPARAECKSEKVEVRSALLGDDDHDKKDDHKHEHAKKDDHKHEHDKHEEEHAEFRVHYHFHCHHPEHLSHVDLGFFRAFPSAAALHARALTPKGQRTAELTAKAPRLKF